MRAFIGLLFALVLTVSSSASSAPAGPSAGADDRAYLVGVLTRTAGPVLEALAANRLNSALPLRDWEKNRRDTAHLEAFARTLAGVAPWIELGAADTPEGALRARFGLLARQSLVNATDPAAPDFMNYGLAKQAGPQALVEAAYIAHALLLAPKVLWEPLTAKQKADVIAALKATRELKPYENNWLLFASIVEAALWTYANDVRIERLEYGVEKFQEWYRGDGTYGDGAEFHWDYYNSYVMHPMLLQVLTVCRAKNHPLASLYDKHLKRAQRYAVVLERMISPEGTFPIVGRSSAYRFGALQGLTHIILLEKLPSSVNPGGARAAITTVVRRMMEAPGTFDAQGWLQVGAVGYQPSLRDHYNNTGALYICLVGLSHLGLPESSDFWQAPAARWTQQRLWAGEDMPGDGALKGL